MYFWVREAHKFVIEINIVGQHHFGDNYTYLGCKYILFLAQSQAKKKRTWTILYHLLTASDQNCCREFLKHRFLVDAWKVWICRLGVGPRCLFTTPPGAFDQGHFRVFFNLRHLDFWDYYPHLNSIKQDKMTQHSTMLL